MNIFICDINYEISLKVIDQIKQLINNFYIPQTLFQNYSFLYYKT